MFSIALPYVNIALDSFALIVSLIIFVSCFSELTAKGRKPNNFIFLLICVIIALIADIVSWIGEGNISLRYMILVSNTVSTCAGRVAIVFFMRFLKKNLYPRSKVANFVLKLVYVLSALSIAFSIGNAFFGYVYAVNPQGHWEHTDNFAMGIAYMFFPIFAFITIIFMSLFARSTTKVNRFAFLLYTLFPVAGAVMDYLIHGLSLTYTGLTVSILVIYTSIYLKKQRIIDEQKNALMISQINPHFIYNTLSTIASMCDIAPNQAKMLTVDFSNYLRRNLSSLSGEELIPFEKELEHIECYLKIEKARFRERLNVAYAIQCKDFQIPPLSIQPLVENAVKHGVTKKGEGGTVRISTYQSDTGYVIEIRDDGAGFDTEAKLDDGRAHIGLENSRYRIKNVCGGDFDIKSRIGVGTRVTISIPKKKRKKK